MDWLINVVIILIILASAIKQLKEESRSKKERGNEIPRTPGPQDYEGHGDRPRPKSISEIFGDAQPDAEDRKPSASPAIPSINDMSDSTVVYHEDAWEESARALAEKTRETLDALEQARTRTQAQASFIRKRTVHHSRCTKHIALQFRGNDLVQGIIMSEILGPPKALQTDEQC